jgi:uncharacterized OB-fold protein
MAQTRPDRTLGPGHNEFWAWCEQGELRLQRCSACGGLSWPVVTGCEHCGGTELAWERMSGRGNVVSWCSFEHDYYRGMFPIPYETIVVELDEGPWFISNPVGFGHAETTFEMPVKLAFLDCEDSAGAFKLPVFEKV